MEASTKARVVRGKALGKALYGCESTPCQSVATRRRTAACKAAIDIGVAPMCSPGLLFATFGFQSPEPLLEVLMCRVRLARTMFHDQNYHSRMQSLLLHYLETGAPGVCSEHAVPQWAGESHCLHVPWLCTLTPESQAAGPLALLWASLARLGIAIDGDWVVHAYMAPCFSLMCEPMPTVKSFLFDIANRAMVWRVGASRASLGPVQSIDWPTSVRHPKGRPRQAANLVNALQAGGVRTDHEQLKAGMAPTLVCSRCQAPIGDLQHMLWYCPALAHCRIAVSNLFAREGIPILSLPSCLRLHGLAPIVCALEGAPAVVPAG